MKTNKETDVNEKVEASRRDFLKAAGKIAVYTPPAMLVLSQPSYATMKGTGGQNYHFQGKRRVRTPKKRWFRQLFGRR